MRVTGQERTIAAIQSDHAEAVVDFLSNKFTNVELYDWMTGVLQGVYAFFLLSGMLVTASFGRQRSVPRFAVLRIARLWPAVAVGSLVTVFIIGPLFTTLTLREYFASGMTWANLDNFSTIVVTPNSGWALPGVFEHNRVPVDIAAPLWTLPLQLRCYLVVLVTGMLGLLSSARGAIASDKVKVLAILEPKRYDKMPDVPSLTEILPEFRKPSTWFGFVGPAKLPPEILARLSTEMLL